MGLVRRLLALGVTASQADRPCPRGCGHVISDHRRGRTRQDGSSVVRCDLCACAYPVASDAIGALDA